MPQFDWFDWSEISTENLLETIRSLRPEALRAALCSYDWAHEPEAVLGWAMAQREIDLGTAVHVFFNGDPARFNYMPKRHVPAEYRGVARALDNICLRINSGFYLAYPGCTPRCEAKLSKWLGYQDVDRSEGRRGRWMLDERILAPMQRDERGPSNTAASRPAPRPSLLRDLLSPVLGLGIDRNLLKYNKPGE
ncbi:hypothetical protein [uncultured Roseovarius sp.]|uniref:hypothetical protein n=1 Tax=uncultured Roseovarius sp. TaxID=293344 RepID=UPI00261923DF|nr:hypothetical protein [uncultured Roseovarius sp.]